MWWGKKQYNKEKLQAVEKEVACNKTISFKFKLDFKFKSKLDFQFCSVGLQHQLPVNSR